METNKFRNGKPGCVQTVSKGKPNKMSQFSLKTSRYIMGNFSIFLIIQYFVVVLFFFFRLFLVIYLQTYTSQLMYEYHYLNLLILVDKNKLNLISSEYFGTHC